MDFILESEERSLYCFPFLAMTNSAAKNVHYIFVVCGAAMLFHFIKS